MKIKLIILVVAFCCFSLLLPAQIRTIQYWFDGNFAERITQQTTSDATQQLSEINAANLPEGLHLIHIRAKDNLRWSVVHSRLFYKTSGRTGNTIASYEYWIDSNFESRERTALSGNIAMVNELNFNTLDNGLHVLHFRVFDNLGNYSAVHSRLFYKNPIPEGKNKIVSYSYWFDDEFDTRQTVTLETPVSVYELTHNFDIPSNWQDGESHAFHIRFRDFSEQWSAATTDSVHVQTLTGLNLLSESGLQIYPNPVKDLLNINLPNSENLESLKGVQILDIAGRVVETLHTTSLQNGTQTINISHLPQGVYFVKVENKTAKFIKR
jgi:hypothetical protein